MDLLNISRAVTVNSDALSALMRSSSAYSGEFAAMVSAYVVSPEQIARDEIFVVRVHDELFYSLVLGKAVELDLMFVADAAQGRGVGNVLFQHLRERAKALGAKHVRIISHPPSLRFYERMGAQQVGVKLAAGNVTWARPILQLAL